MGHYRLERSHCAEEGSVHFIFNLGFSGIHFCPDIYHQDRQFAATLQVKSVLVTA